MTTKDDIRRWFESGLEKGASYMLVFCDTYDWSDYPVYAFSSEECLEKYDEPRSMTKIMEVYDLTVDIEAQLSERRCFNLPKEKNND